jgi:hypothetical protein
MKSILNKTMVSVAILSAICFTACDENSTIDVEGPSIDFTFEYGSLRDASTGFILIAEDSIKGADVEQFLSDSTSESYSDIVEAASIINPRLTVSGGDYDFTGIDSVQIRYEIVGTNSEIILVSGTGSEGDSIIVFNDVRATKEQAYKLIGNDIVARFYAATSNTSNVNCFQTGALFHFTAQTTLSVKVSDATKSIGL